jgi:cell division septum initiation protein DivIVA
MSSHKLPPQRRPPATAADAAQRLATIVDAAERAAQGVIDDAEEQARRHVEEARARADGIIAERLRELADELDSPTSGEQAPHLRSVEAGSGEDERPPRRSTSAGARLLATQMAISGAGREEIEARLRSGFEIDDTVEIVDAILGPEE